MIIAMLMLGLRRSLDVIRIQADREAQSVSQSVSQSDRQADRLIGRSIIRRIDILDKTDR